MKTSYTHNNFLAYLAILAGFFILLFFTKNIFSQMQVALDEKEGLQIELQEKEETLSKLNILQKTLEEDENILLDEIHGLTAKFSDSDILEYLHAYASSVNLWEERIIIRDITLNGDIQTDIGFRKAEIGVSLIASWEKTLFNFINYLTSDSEKYRFYITNFNYPMDQSSGNIQVNIPLTLYYK